MAIGSRNFDRGGSFQRGAQFWSENPLEELWSQISRMGKPAWLAEGLTSSNPNLSVQEITEYSTVRFRQAVEFRNAGATGSLLTSPLPLYYSFLNLLRAATAVHASKIPSKSHGLTFVEGASVMACGAKIVKGSFTDYLTAAGASFTAGDMITLEECLSLIPELEDIYQGHQGSSFVVPMRVQVKGSGDAWLHFYTDKSEESDFTQNWASWFPKLANVCALDHSGATLKLLSNVTVEQAEQFCADHLEMHLTRLDHALWYAIKHTIANAGLPRPATYFTALFILGSVVRYQPEKMLDVTQPDSEDGWFLARFIRVAERFYPNLLFNWMHDRNFFF